MSQGHHLRIRLFLEGIEVPVIAAVVQAAANSPATATIQVIATDKVLDLLPRTVVHLFYYDYVEVGHVALDRKRDELGEEKYIDWFNSRYKILFSGEFVTMNFEKSPRSRAVVLNCADFSNYWDTTFQYNFNGCLFSGQRQAAFIGANSNFFTSPLGHGTGTIARLLNGRSVNFPELRGLLAGVVRMLEAIGGSYYGRDVFRGCNDFTSIAELRLKILQQITAAEKDTSTAKLFARKTFAEWMNRSIQGLGQLVSFRGLVQVCFGYIFHEVYPCPVARYVPSGNRDEPRSYSVGLDQTRYASFAKKTRESLELVERAKSALTTWRQAAGGDGNAHTALTNYVRSWISAEKSINALYAIGMSTAPKMAHKDLAIANEKMGQIRAISAEGNLVSGNWDYYYGTLDRNHAQISEYYAPVIDALKDILGIREVRSKVVTVDTQPRLNNQIFRPDVWFTAPPRCNVLFPEHYHSFSFSRQYLREVSRMELQTHNEILGNDALFNGRYYAPNVEDVRRGVKLSSQRFARLIMDHELFTGIVPMFENMSEVNLFAMRSGAVQKSGAKVSYAQRAVNFQYFKYRFDSRAMSAFGRFNPQFVPGFPSLIIDRPMGIRELKISSMPTADQIKELGLSSENLTAGELLKQLVGPQYLGVCASLSHSVSQEGGTTAYQFIHARVHRETTEFLGVDKVSARVPVGSANSRTIVAGPPGMKFKTGLNGGIVKSCRDVTDSNKGRFYSIMETGIAVQIGEFYPKSTFYFDDTSDPEELFEARAYELREWIIKYKEEKMDLPIEEALAPPWIWDGWRVPKVSETYEQLFGITAITDTSGYTASQTNDSVYGQRFYIGEDELDAVQKQQLATSSGRGKKSAASAKSGSRSAEIAKNAKNQVALMLMDKEITIENSVDFLVRAYSLIKANNLDIGDFLKAYGWRPVATMIDILGSSDLEIKKVTRKVQTVVKQRYVKKPAVYGQYPLAAPVEVLAEPVYGTRFVKKPVEQTYYEATGTEGFHSRAFGDVEDLFGLVNPTVRQVLKLTSGDRRRVAARLDVRKRRRAVVRGYVEELTRTKGLIG